MALWQVKKEVALGTGHTCRLLDTIFQQFMGTPVKLRAVSLGRVRWHCGR